MDILAKARQLESTIARRLDRTAKDLVRSRSHDPLEVAHAVVEEVEGQIEPGSRGTRVFPFTCIAVSVVASSPDTRARFEAVLETSPSLGERIAERLLAAGCSAPPPSITIDYVARAHKNWSRETFDIRFSRAREAPLPQPHARTVGPIELTVIRGVTDQERYSFTATRIDIGRGREVRDSHHRLIRGNDIAFTEGGDSVNQSVSRRHAHIGYDEQTNAFRVHDDGSSHGTAVMRAGRTLTVARGVRGVRLRDGDEIVLGDARIRVAL
jgi:FHA domain